MGSFEPVSRERVMVQPVFVLLCACPRAGDGMAQLNNSENLASL
jgi:hypothetical protein